MERGLIGVGERQFGRGSRRGTVTEGQVLERRREAVKGCGEGENEERPW